MKGLVLEGGGAKGAYHAGAIIALSQNHIKFDAVVGTSIGSVNAAYYALGDYKKLKYLWLTTTCEELFNVPVDVMKSLKKLKFNKETLKSSVETLEQITFNLGIDTTNMKRILNDTVDEDKLRKSGIKFGLCTYNLSEHKPIKLFLEDIPYGKVSEYLMASSYLPIFKLEKIINNKFYLDGGVFDRCPIDMLIDKGYDEIFVVKSYTNRKRIKTNGEKLTFITPKHNLGSTLMFEPESVKYNLYLGYYDTLKVIKKLDGNDYYIKFKSNKYYSKMIKNKNIIFKYIYKNDKQLIIRILENCCKEFDINKFKVYNINTLLRKVKKKIKKNKRNKYYKFIMNLKVRWF